MTFVYILLAILLLGILIMVHELGHFLSARACGIEVREFAIGMGPKLFSRQGKRTLFSLRAIPLGGFCSFYGEDDPTESAKDDPRALAKQPAWKRLITILAGPLMNFVLAYVVAVILMCAYSGTVTDYYVYSVSEGSAAQAAGIEPGDIFTTIDGVNVLDDSFDLATQQLSIRRENDTMTVTVLRDGEEVYLSATAAWNEEESRYYLGVAMMPHMQPVTFGEAVGGAAGYCVEVGGAVFEALRQLVSGKVNMSDMSGPVGVIQVVAEQTAVGGLSTYLSLMVLISVNLGIMNLLPIPGLDGSRALFLILEIIRRKPVPAKKEAIVHLIGLGALLLFSLYITFQDVLKIFK